MNETLIYINKIFEAKTKGAVCEILKVGINDLKGKRFFTDIPDYYQDMEVDNVEMIITWFDAMRDDNNDEEFGEENLRELFGLVNAAYDRLVELGFRRED